MELASEAEIRWGDEPSVLIFGDNPVARADAAAAVAGVGARLIGEGTLAEALGRLNRQAAVDSVIFELDANSGSEADRLIEWANQAARTGASSAILSIPTALIDRAMARIEDPNVILLCEPKMSDRVAALGLALGERRNRLHEGGIETEAERLRRLSEEVARVAAALAQMSHASASAAQQAIRPVPRATAEAPIDAHAVRGMIRLRRMRGQFFSEALFADPAWDMLLDLMAARLERTAVAVSSLCIAAAVPATTALRWIRTLTEHGLFVRRADPDDGRRVFIELSDEAADSMTAFFETARQMGWWPA